MGTKRQKLIVKYPDRAVCRSEDGELLR
jgi:hypothetical protein